MKKNVLSLIFLILFFSHINAQYTSPYQLSYAKDISIPTVALAMLGSSLLLDRNVKPLSINEINLLDRSQVNKFDRNATYNWDKKAARWSDGIMVGTAALPLLFLIDKRSRNDFAKVSTIYAEIFVTNLALTNLTKVLTKRKRPYLYNPNTPLSEKIKKDALHSFFSGHVSITASMTYGFAQIYTDYFPNSQILPFVWFGAAVLPLINGILRNKAGKHYWTDVIVGYVVGAAVGILIPKLHLAR